MYQQQTLPLIRSMLQSFVSVCNSQLIMRIQATLLLFS